MNENDSEVWQTPVFRSQIIRKIEEEITKLGAPSLKSSQQLENENYEKASSKEEYLKLIALLISYMRQKSQKQSVTTSNLILEQSEATSSKLETELHKKYENRSSPSKWKNIYTPTTKKRKLTHQDEQFICAVCGSIFSSKVSLRNHIKITRHEIKETIPKSIMATLPQQWLFTVIDYFKTSSGYKMEICLPSINSVELTQDWMGEFMKHNKCTYAWERTSSNVTNTQHEVVYCCHYSEKRAKSTCKSKISFILKKEKFSYATVTIDFDHDHSIPYKDDSRQCNPSSEVKEMLFKYFENSASPNEAFRNMQIHVETQLKTEEEFLEYSSDRRKMPGFNWVRNIYNTEYLNNKPTNLSQEEIDLLKKFIADKNEEHGETICQFQELPNKNFVIFIVTACMKRALKGRSASELVYTDNIGSTVQFGFRIYLLLTNIRSEAVPLAVMISSSETNKAIKTGFGLLATYLDDESFDGRGRLGPAIIMTDDSLAELVSMKALFPYSKIVLSVYHFLKACYKWLIKIEHKINKKNREIIYTAVRQMVYAEDETVLKTLFDNLAEVYRNHELVTSYICKLYEKRQSWALCYRRNFLTMEESQHDTWKHSLCALKEQILNSMKFQEPKRLMSYFLGEFSEFYRRRLMDCALHKSITEKQLYENHFENHLFIQNSHCESLFTLQNCNTNVNYLINTDINLCTCYMGCIGTLCDHQKLLAIYLKDYFKKDDNPVNDAETKLELYYIVSGCRDVPEEFFGLSNQTNDSLQFDEEIQPMFDDVQTETIIDDSNTHHVLIQHIIPSGEKCTSQELKIQQTIDDHNISQVYPIIIEHDDDEGIVQIDDTVSSDENLPVESAPQIVYSILFDSESINDELILPISDVTNSECMSEIKDCSDIKEETTYEGESREEAVKREITKFNQHFLIFREMIKKNPILYKAGLLHLNNQLAKIKNDPTALFQAMNSLKLKI